MRILYLKSEDGKVQRVIGVTKLTSVIIKLVEHYGYRVDWCFVKSPAFYGAICSKSLRNFIDKNIS